MCIKLQATRDLFLIWWSNEEGRSIRAETHKNHNEETIHQDHRNAENADGFRNSRIASSGLTYSSLILVVTKLSADQYKPLFTRRRLRNALWSSCTVALAQQLCGSRSLLGRHTMYIANMPLQSTFSHSTQVGHTLSTLAITDTLLDGIFSDYGVRTSMGYSFGFGVYSVFV
jgi:hypothetical protein